MNVQYAPHLILTDVSWSPVGSYTTFTFSTFLATYNDDGHNEEEPEYAADYSPYDPTIPSM